MTAFSRRTKSKSTLEDPSFKLTTEDFQEAASILDCEVAAIMAVAKIETNGKPFVTKGYPTILFEGHIFWEQLEKRGQNPARILANNPGVKDILYRHWTRKYYRTGMAEYGRLDRAVDINREAGLASASWGAFQIMGFNFASCGYRSVVDFVNDMKVSAKNHLLAFCHFMKSNNLQHLIQSHDWAAFARHYNGVGYAQNKYDTKLAYEYNLAKEQLA